MIEKEIPNYYGIITAEVRYSKCSPNAKLLYSEITALSNQWGYCSAGNEYFAGLYEVHKNTISAWVSELIEAGFIEIFIENGNKRKIYLKELKKPIPKARPPVQEKLNGGSGKPEASVQEKLNGGSGKPEANNNTFNNTSNITFNKEKKFPPVEDFDTEKILNRFKSANIDIDNAIAATYGTMNQTEFSQIYTEYWNSYWQKNGKPRGPIDFAISTKLWSALRYEPKDKIIIILNAKEEAYKKSYWGKERKRPYTQLVLWQQWEELDIHIEHQIKEIKKYEPVWKSFVEWAEKKLNPRTYSAIKNATETWSDVEGTCIMGLDLNTQLLARKFFADECSAEIKITFK